MRLKGYRKENGHQNLLKAFVGMRLGVLDVSKVYKPRKLHMKIVNK
jgi:hypothetical protein